MAVSGLREGLLPLTQTAMRFYNRIGYHDYEGPTIDARSATLASTSAPTIALILRNHGLLTCGRSVPQAFNTMYWLETACRVQVDCPAATVLCISRPPPPSTIR